jgi:hypothetical protein
MKGLIFKINLGYLHIVRNLHFSRYLSKRVKVGGMDWNAPEFGRKWNEGVSHSSLHTVMRNFGRFD